MKTRLRVIGLFLSVGFLATSCGGLKVPGASSTTSSRSTQPGGDPREDLKKAFTAQLAAKSFRYRMNFESSFLSGSHVESEFVAPDRYHNHDRAITGPRPRHQSRNDHYGQRYFHEDRRYALAQD